MAALTSPTKKLEGKVAVVTSGASGIGEVTAIHFTNNGARTVVIADIQDDKGKELFETIGFHRSTYFHCDVSDEGQVKSMIDRTVEIYGQIDVMFSNAGVISTRSNQTVLDLDFSEFDRLFAVNVRGMTICVKHATRAMVERRVKGSIVCTASVLASKGGVRETDYVMSKHAVLGLVRSASMHGIRVNCVLPFGLATPLTCQLLGMEEEGVERENKSFVPLKGTVFKAKHVADAVLVLASDDSELVSGHNMVVNGGFLA